MTDSIVTNMQYVIKHDRLTQKKGEIELDMKYNT